jgi:hypothetical protein
MMHGTIIREVGLHPRILQVGNKQVMHFIEGADGPFWMTPAQRLEKKHGRQLGTAKSRAKTKIELLKELHQSGYDTTKQRYLKEDLVALCGPRNICTTVEEQKMKEGWLGKPKGIITWQESSQCVTEQCRSVQPSVTCVSSVLAFAHARSHSSETTTSHLFYNQQFGATIRLSATTTRAIPTLYGPGGHWHLVDLHREVERWDLFVLLDGAAQVFSLVVGDDDREKLEKLAYFHLYGGDDFRGFCGFDASIGLRLEEGVIKDASGVDVAFNDGGS